MGTLQLFLLRLFNISLGRFNFFARLMKNILIRLLILKKTNKYMASSKFFNWDDLE